MPKNIVNIYHFGQKVQTWIIGLNHTNQTLLIKIHNRANFKSVPADLMQRLVPEQRPPALPGPPGQPAAAVPRAGPAPSAPASPRVLASPHVAVLHLTRSDLHQQLFHF